MSVKTVMKAVAGSAVAAAMLAACTPASSSGGATSSATPEPNITSSSVAAEAPAGTIDPCSLITAERLTEITGHEIAEGIFNGSHSDSGRNVCDWRPVDEERSEPRVTVTVNWGFPDATEHRRLAEELAGEGKDASFEGATNAYTMQSRTTWGMNVTDDYFLKVSYIQPSNSNDGDIAKAITRDVLAAMVEEVG